MGVNHFQVCILVSCLNLLAMYLHSHIFYFFYVIEEIHSSRKPNPKCQVLEGVWDFKQWIQPFQGNVGNHSKIMHLDSPEEHL